MTTCSDETMELALAFWPQYTRETLPPQIYTAVARRVVREQREEQEEQDGTAERRRAAHLAVAQDHQERQARGCGVGEETPQALAGDLPGIAGQPDQRSEKDGIPDARG